MSEEWHNFIENIRDSSFQLIKGELKKFIKNTVEDSNAFAKQQGEKIEKYLIQLAAGQITKEQFLGNIEDLKILAQMEVRKNRVETKAAAQRITDGIAKLIIDGLGKVI